MWGNVAVTAVIGSIVWLGISYPPFAEARGWRRGAWVGGNGWYLYHGVAVLSVLFTGWKYGSFLGVAVVIVVGWFVAFALILVLRSWSQTVSLLSLPLALGWHLMIP